MGQGTILKTADIKLAARDAFPSDTYSYYEDDTCFMVAGRYYIHNLYKATMEWSLIEAEE